MDITRFTQTQERHGPLLAFRRETFSRNITTTQAAALLLQQARDLKLTERTELYGNTLNDWMTGGKPPSWAISAAMIWLENNDWYPGIDCSLGNSDTPKSATSDFAWWAYTKIKLHGSLADAVKNIPSSWPLDVIETAKEALQLSWQVEENKLLERVEKRHE